MTKRKPRIRTQAVYGSKTHPLDDWVAASLGGTLWINQEGNYWEEVLQRSIMFDGKRQVVISIVLECFEENPGSGFGVGHLDHNKSNNAINNLV
jgi:hypothetical protein